MKKQTVIRILILLFISCQLIAGELYAQVRFYTLLSEGNIGTGQPFQVQYIIEGASQVKEFKYPSFNNFTVHELFENQNASKSQSKSLAASAGSFAKIAVLSPRKAGNFAIPGATAIINGILMRSNAVKLQVSPNSAFNNTGTGSRAQGENESEILPGQTIPEKIRDNFFITAEVDKTSCYVGEPLMAVYKMCSRLNASSQVVKRPSLTGFSVIEMVNSYDDQPETEIIDGRPFSVHLIRKVQLFPLQAGNYELEGAEVESVVYFVKKIDQSSAAEELRDLIDGRRDRQAHYSTITHKVALASKPLPITVKPLPEQEQPEQFSGAVGNFQIGMIAHSDKIEGGAPAKISFVISGTGNFPLVTAPDIVWPEGLEVSTEQTNEQTDPYVFPLSGKKTFSYSITGTKVGAHLIPAATFAYFDPKEEKYKTIQTKPFTVTVVSSANAQSAIPEKTLANTGNTSKYPRHYYWFGAIVLVIIGWILYQVFSGSKTKKTEIKEPVEREIKHPEPLEKEAFSAAEFAIMQGDQKKFYKYIQKALVDFVALRCSILPSALNKHNIAGALHERKVSADLIIQLQELLNECEWALYTPDTTQSDMYQMLQRSKTLYKELSTVCSANF